MLTIFIYIYSILFTIALPLVLARLYWRSLREIDYRRRWRERLGVMAKPPAHLAQAMQRGGRVLWVHAVSVGEVRAAAPFIQALLRDYANDVVLITCLTPTGSAMVKQLFADQVWHSYLPYDAPLCLRLFYRKSRPALLVIFETELWPGLIYWMTKSKVPILLANARLTAKSTCRYLKIKYFIRPIVRMIDQVAAQSTYDAVRFIALGIRSQRLIVAGNIKYDLQVPSDLLPKAKQLALSLGFAHTAKVWTAGSIHAESDLTELTAILQAQQVLLAQDQQVKLILVPRHLRSIKCYQQTLSKMGLSYVLRSDNQPLGQDHQVLLVDTMGELLLFYALAQVCVVGGSLIDIGGHNLLEPAALAKPIISGPYLQNCAEIRDQLQQAAALKMVANGAELAAQLAALFADEKLAEQMGKAAYHVFTQQQGVLPRYLSWIDKKLKTINN